MGKTNLCSFKSRKLSFGEGVGLWLEEPWEAFCGADNILFLNTEAVFILWKACIFMKCALFSMYITLKKINNKMWCIQHTIEYYSVLKRNSDTYYNTEAPGGHYAKWRKPVTEGLRLIPHTWGAYRSQCTETETWAVARGGKRFLKIGSRRVWMYLTLVNCTCKNN